MNKRYGVYKDDELIYLFTDVNNALMMLNELPKGLYEIKEVFLNEDGGIIQDE